MDGRSPTSSPSSLGPKAEGSPPLRPAMPRTTNGRPEKPGKRKVSKGMIKRVEGGGVGLMNPMGWYDAERNQVPLTEEPSPLVIPPSGLDLGSPDEKGPKEAVRNGSGDLAGIMTESPSVMSSDP